jgi:hypothetical protein
MPNHQAVVPAQTDASPQVMRAGLVQAKEAGHAHHFQQGHEDITAKAPVARQQVAGLKQLAQAKEQGQFGQVFVALGVTQQGPAGQAEVARHFEQRKAAAGLLALRLRIGSLVGRGVRHAQGGAIDNFGPPAAPELLVLRQDLFGVIGGSGAGALQDGQGQAFPGRAIGALPSLSTGPGWPAEQNKAWIWRATSRQGAAGLSACQRKPRKVQRNV